MNENSKKHKPQEEYRAVHHFIDKASFSPLLLCSCKTFFITLRIFEFPVYLEVQALVQSLDDCFRLKCFQTTTRFHTHVMITLGTNFEVALKFCVVEYLLTRCTFVQTPSGIDALRELTMLLFLKSFQNQLMERPFLLCAPAQCERFKFDNNAWGLKHRKCQL